MTMMMMVNDNDDDGQLTYMEKEGMLGIIINTEMTH